MDDGDPLRLRPLRFFGQPAHVLRVAGQQPDRPFQVERGGHHDGIDGTPVTG